MTIDLYKVADLPPKAHGAVTQDGGSYWRHWRYSERRQDVYTTQKRIDEGRQTMRRHPQRDLTAGEVREIKEQAADVYEFGNNMFLLGVAIGARITQQEGRQ